MKIGTKQKHESKVIPGVAYTLHLVTEPIRSRLREKISKHMEAIEEITDELRPLYLERQAGEISHDQQRKIRTLEAKIDSIESDHIDPEWIKTVLVSTDLEVDDVLITADNIKNAAPTVFYAEVLQQIKSLAVLSPEEAKN